MKQKHFAVLLSAALLGGCAFTDAQLDIRSPADAKFKGPMTEIGATTFEFKPLTDTRPDKQRIGWKKNGFGQNTADITSKRDVTVVVTDAVTEGLRQNGHTVGVPSNITVSGSVTRFWFEFDPNFFTIEFIGNVESDLEFVDSRSGKAVHKGHYTGTFSKKVAGGLDATWTEVMNAALGKMVEDVVFDEDLIEALQATAQAAK